ncbi:MAG: hypothetical protein N0C81_11605 [Candidatus Thiodiazotropha lotti]|uniref:Uncharacterized protein n=1 Tax=Candidatus Thiodiazotropha lotti TaxID=2792787 RepID=A0A9E4K5X7_9GAMM|nr:hypothetical protein [Candidatus Thiodiazotropha lotti]ODC00045.1 hypothetical protein A3197_06575 [Candidatus Thiodiazotropha endoloripes]MCG7922319.1 hypothetical protein [Candidatus Thiodiazotropha lotti]MCG7931394.1 hypothetical protein [Candidatus Thiodiazotropha lotti]MCG7939029.1 hypothetical protein [Candidatus Thiodiazotropha lotti]
MFEKLFNKVSNCKFKQAESTLCVMCCHVLEKNTPILSVAHDMEDIWQFFCGADGHEYNDIRIVTLSEVTELDSCINELSEIPLGAGAIRASTEEAWRQYTLDVE